jgi:uncharacterized protein YidB (DUF937 family)
MRHGSCELPGTLNHKHSPPVAVTCVRAEPGVLAMAEVVGGLPDSAEYLAIEHKRRPAHAGGQGALAGLTRTVREAREGSRNQALYWAGCRASEHINAGELDEHTSRAELHDAALAAGLDEGEIEATPQSALARTETA